MSIRLQRFLSCAAGMMVAGFALASAASASAQVSEQVIYNFPASGQSGTLPASKLLSDGSGRLFGVTDAGGSANGGTVFELTAPVNGVRNFHVLRQFTGLLTDARNPMGNLVFDVAGNLYGAALGGKYNSGAVYKLTPNAGGAWTESIIYDFVYNYPMAGLTIDAAGNLYGTTYQGSNSGYLGSVYELTRNSDGSWTQEELHIFGATNDGALPAAELVFDTAGNLYGTTTSGGVYGYGTVFEVSPTSGGHWKEQVLYSFPGGKTLQRPEAPVWLDSGGNLYGTTAGPDTTPSFGGAYELTANADGSWLETTLHAFGQTGDGALPTSGLVANSFGTLFGTTAAGGANGLGTVYVLEQNASGQWIERAIYSFSGTDGRNPRTELTFGKGQILYGTTSYGGSGNVGAVYQVTP